MPPPLFPLLMPPLMMMMMPSLLLLLEWLENHVLPTLAALSLPLLASLDSRVTRRPNIWQSGRRKAEAKNNSSFD
jgi:hypothetical protein